MLLNLTLILSLIFTFPSGKFESSCTYEAVGGKVVISFDDVKVQESDELRWTHNERKVYFKKRSQVRISEFNVGDDGSLILENIQTHNSGDYRGIIYGADGKLRKQTVKQLCVLEPVPEPTIKFECVENGVNLTCSAVNNNEVAVSWMENGMKANVTQAFLYVSSSEIKSGDNFSCTVSNKISHKSSKSIEPVCSDTGMSENRFLVGLDLLMLVILTGGGSFLILFIICLVSVCCCWRRNKRKAKRREQAVSLMPYYLSQPDQ